MMQPLGMSKVMSNNAKIPFWVCPSDLKILTSVVGNYLDSENSGSQREIAMSINHELGVANTRFSHGRIPAHLLQQALNVSKDSLPIHLSSEEVNFLLNLDLPTQMKDTFND